MWAHCQPKQNKILTEEEVENASFGIVWNSNMAAQTSGWSSVLNNVRNDGFEDVKLLWTSSSPLSPCSVRLPRVCVSAGVGFSAAFTSVLVGVYLPKCVRGVFPARA